MDLNDRVSGYARLVHLWSTPERRFTGWESPGARAQRSGLVLRRM